MRVTAYENPFIKYTKKKTMSKEVTPEEIKAAQTL